MILLEILWLLWAVVVAAIWRLALRKFVFTRLTLWMAVATYILMAGIGFCGILLSEALGFRLYGYNPDDAMQYAAMLVLVYSPIGLPLLVGIPFVAAWEAIRAFTKKREETEQ